MKRTTSNTTRWCARTGSWSTPRDLRHLGEQPAELRERVLDGQAARQRFVLRGHSQTAVGIPLPSVDAAYFEVVSLDELSRTLGVLRTSLVAASFITFSPIAP